MDDNLAYTFILALYDVSSQAFDNTRFAISLGLFNPVLGKQPLTADALFMFCLTRLIIFNTYAELFLPYWNVIYVLHLKIAMFNRPCQSQG